MKKLFIIPLISSLFLMSCTKSEDTSTDASTDSTPAISETSSYSNTKVTLPSANNISSSPTTNLAFSGDDLFHSEFVSIGELLFFSDNNNNNKLSVTTSSLNSSYISEEDILDIYDYSIESLTAIDNMVYFTSISDNYNLYKLDYEKKAISLISSKNFSKIISSENDLIYLTKDTSSTLNVYNTKDNTSLQLTSDKCGSFIVNGDYILYSNLSDHSSLYVVKKDGTERRKLTNTSVDSFVTYDKYVIYIDGTDNNLYLFDTSTNTSKRLDLLNGANLKSYNESYYYINLADSNYLYSFTLTDDLAKIEKSLILKNSTNTYYPITTGIFSRNGININRNYFTAY